MAESMEWVKLKTDIFENRKIRYLLSMRSGESIVLMYIRLICLAGQCGTSGELMLCDGVPYDSVMLADALGYNDFDDGTGEAFVQAVLNQLVKFHLINFDGECYSIASWEEHQAVKELDRKREKNRERQKRWYDKNKKKALDKTLGSALEKDVSSSSNNADLTKPNADITGQSKSKSKSIKKETPKGVSKESAKHKFGENQNVLLSDSELTQLKEKFPSDWQTRIDNLSWYLSTHNASYKNHYMTILSWDRRDKQKQQTTRPSSAYNEEWGF